MGDSYGVPLGACLMITGNFVFILFTSLVGFEVRFVLWINFLDHPFEPSFFNLIHFFGFFLFKSKISLYNRRVEY